MDNIFWKALTPALLVTGVVAIVLLCQRMKQDTRKGKWIALLVLCFVSQAMMGYLFLIENGILKRPDFLTSSRLSYSLNTHGLKFPTPEYKGEIMQALSQRKSLEELEALLKSGVDVNFMEENGQTPLQYATCIGEFEKVKLFVEYGADVNRGKDIYRPILAIAKNNDEYNRILKYLLDHGAKPDIEIGAPEEAKYTPLMALIYKDNIKGAEMLLGKISDEKFLKDNPPIVLAGYASLDSLKYWSQKYNNAFETKNIEGETVLHSAVREQNPKNIKWLLENGADPAAKNNAGLSPLGLAKVMKKQELINAFKNHN